MKATNKVIVGIFAVFCLLLFGVGLFLIGSSNQLFTRSFRISADFAKITGIQKGGKVRVAGMDAGTVTDILVPSQPQAKFRVQFRVIEKLHPLVRQDSVVTIQTDGLLGNKYLEVDAGSPNVEMARDNSQIRSAEPFDWGDLMEQISSAVKQVNGILAGVKDQLSSTLTQIEEVAKSANGIIKDATPEVKSILVSADKISRNLNEIIDGVEKGKGTVGALLKDDAMQASLRRSVDTAGQVAENIREVSASAKSIVGKVDESDIVPEVQRTMQNLQHISRQIREAVDKFQTASGEGGVVDNLQRTLADAQEAMSDLSDDTEALKHSFFFRGFFKKRGFYDLGVITTPEYTNGKFAKGFKKHRVSMEHADMFSVDAAGVETLSEAGKRKLDEAMTEILKFPRNGPLIIEGFASLGTPAQQYLVGRRRASRVEAYIVGRFHLRPAYIGLVAMGVFEASNGAGPKEGVAIVSFYK